VASELQKIWNSEDAMHWAEVCARIFPLYNLLIKSYMRAQEVIKKNEARTPSVKLKP
jgi:hypothetical protein